MSENSEETKYQPFFLLRLEGPKLAKTVSSGQSAEQAYSLPTGKYKLFLDIFHDPPPNRCQMWHTRKYHPWGCESWTPQLSNDGVGHSGQVVIKRSDGTGDSFPFEMPPPTRAEKNDEEYEFKDWVEMGEYNFSAAIKVEIMVIAVLGGFFENFEDVFGGSGSEKGEGASENQDDENTFEDLENKENEFKVDELYGRFETVNLSYHFDFYKP